MSNKKQTAVEWLRQTLRHNSVSIFSGNIADQAKNLEQVFQQAKEMEKEQMKGMYVEGSFAKMRYYDGLEYIDAEQYYEQTYGGNK
jgi:hypothetical protein